MHLKHLTTLASATYGREAVARGPHFSSRRNIANWRRRILANVASLASIVFIACVFATPSFAAQYYAAPNGTSSGDGSISRPWSLSTALSKSTTVKPGDTIWLRGGTYGTGGGTLFVSSLNGSATAPVIVRQYKGERATVNGGINAKGSYTWFWGFEITNTSTNRYVSDINSGRQPGIYLYGRGNKVINLIINNAGRAAVGFWSTLSSGSDNEVYGTIMWGNGIYDSTGTRRGDAIYANLSDPNPKLALISDNIAFRNFNLGIKGWSEWSSKYVNNFQLINNVSWDNNWSYDLEIANSVKQLTGLKLIGNMTYQPKSETRNCTRFGTSGLSGGSAEVRDNYFVCGPTPLTSLYVSAQSVTVSGNTVIQPSRLIAWNPAPSTAYGVVTGNHYYGGGSAPFRRSSKAYTFTSWKNMGYDKTGTYSTAYPTVPKVFVKPNKYEAGRAHVIIYNWRRDASVPVDLSSVLKPGDVYEVRDAQNYWGTPVVKGTYGGGSVSFPTRLTAVAPIPGATHFVNNHSDMEFNVYVVIKK